MKNNDFINMEYEARAMVSENQYLQILAHFLKSKEDKKQFTNFNTYFDYEDLFLTNNHMVLRTRRIGDNEYELTLKIKGDKGDIEYNTSLTSNQYDEMKRSTTIPDSIVKDKLLENNIDLNKLQFITDLKTDRLEVYSNNHIIVIDKNYYRNRVDYNVEVESNSKESAISVLNDTFSSFGVTYKKGYISKSRRAIFNL